MHDFEVRDEILRKGEDEFWVGVDDRRQRGADLKNGSLHYRGASKALELGDGAIHHVNRHRQLKYKKDNKTLMYSEVTHKDRG